MTDTTASKPLFLDFLDAFVQIPFDLQKALLNLSGDEDEKRIIDSLMPALTEQFQGLSFYIKEIAEKASLQENEEVEKFLRISSGLRLASDFKLALPSIGSIIGKLGIVGIIHEIKKLIEAIIELFRKVPKWLEKLFLIIDQIINTLLGGGSTKTKNMLSEAEVNFLKERRHRILLEKAAEYNTYTDEDEN